MTRQRARRGRRVAGTVLAACLLASVPGVARAAGPAAPGSARRPSGDYHPGIDVSHWQGTIDWPRVAGAGYEFVIAKATEGRTFDDPNYASNKVGATAAGLLVGAYHFARPDDTRGDPRAEADHYVDVAALLPGDLIPALDLEVSGGLGQEDLLTWTKRWLRRVRERVGVKPMIYTSARFWRTYMGDTTFFADNGYRILWVAHWTTGQPDVPAANWAGRGWTFWQWTDCLSVPGISGCVDGDYYRPRSFDRVTIP